MLSILCADSVNERLFKTQIMFLFWGLMLSALECPSFTSLLQWLFSAFVWPFGLRMMFLVY